MSSAPAPWRIREKETALLLIPCPHCGERDETEFRYGGEIQSQSPSPPDAPISVEEWGERLFLRKNDAGVISESWFHIHGCQCWITLTRDTRTDEFQGRTSGDGS